MDQYQQLSFADAEYANKGKVTRCEKFLDQLESLLPRSVMRSVIERIMRLVKDAGPSRFP
jgi:transposase, IS5 family